MRPFFTLPSIWTKSSQVELAYGLTDMFLAAPRTKWTKAFVIMRTRWQLRRWINMQVQAFIAIGAVKRSGEVVAFWHTSPAHRSAPDHVRRRIPGADTTETGSCQKKANLQVVLMQKLALIPFLT